MKEFLVGALAMASLIAALLFWQFWKRSRERLFALFAAAFVAMALNWIGVAIIDPSREGGHLIYLVRLAAFVLIIVAIFDRNRREVRREAAPATEFQSGARRSHGRLRRRRENH